MGSQLACCVTENSDQNEKYSKEKKNYQAFENQKKRGPQARMPFASSEEFSSKGNSQYFQSQNNSNAPNFGGNNNDQKTEGQQSNNIQEQKNVRGESVNLQPPNLRNKTNSSVSAVTDNDEFYSFTQSAFTSQISQVTTVEMTDKKSSNNVKLQLQPDEAISEEQEKYIRETFGLECRLPTEEEQKQQQKNNNQKEDVDMEEKYSEKQKLYLQKVKETAEYLQETQDLDALDCKWKQHTKKGTLLCHIYQEDDTGYFATRVEDEFKITDMKQFCDEMMDFDVKMTIDGMFEWGKYIEQIIPEEYVTVSHQKYKGVAIVKARDAVALQGKYILPNGAICLCGRSLTDEEFPFEETEAVRVDCNLAGWYVKPVEDGEQDMYQVIYVSKINAKGKIPMYIKKGTSKFPIDMVKAVKKMWEKRTIQRS